jgi:hypothetical protein
MQEHADAGSAACGKQSLSTAAVLTTLTTRCRCAPGSPRCSAPARHPGAAARLLCCRHCRLPDTVLLLLLLLASAAPGFGLGLDPAMQQTTAAARQRGRHAVVGALLLLLADHHNDCKPCVEEEAIGSEAQRRLGSDSAPKKEGRQGNCRLVVHQGAIWGC